MTDIERKIEELSTLIARIALEERENRERQHQELLAAINNGPFYIRDYLTRSYDV